MKKERVITCSASIAILLVALTVMIVDFVVPLQLWTHPILNFLFCVFVGYGVYFLVLGIVKKSAWYMFISAILLALSIVYVLCQYVFALPWWAIVIVTVVFCLIIAFVCIMLAGYKTEDIAINKSQDYKDYYQRKADKCQYRSGY